jgi:hypothetical protein
MTAPIRDPMIDQMLERDGAYASINETRVEAMAAYLGALRGWRPSQLDVPLLFVRAGRPIPGLSADSDWQSSWDLAHTLVEVPGDHFTIVDDHAHLTAEAVEQWLGTTYG